ncbi:serine/threonine-protein phosphatase with EF-hands 2-like isoform X3 [Amphiura filiformis]|uniref:serine/threonine-protein phosphatase with EF-hands 2-like isoform X3 n=1 Tax=Amphiura filiformis TaxID=82378 RepID=UPI003B225A80
MGCGGSNQAKCEMGSTEKSIKAALLIQRWYRRYQARLEARRRCTWNIFQSLEYAGEQDQLKLYNFFNDMMSVINDDSKNAYIVNGTDEEGTPSKDGTVIKNPATDFSDIEVEADYKGAHLTFPLTIKMVQELIESFKNGRILHTKYVLQVLSEARKILREKPNINQATTAIAKQITVCGDLHGKLDDLLVIFYKNGLPSPENPYVFNGDFVDRGPFSVETAILLFCCFLLYPNEVYLNRGNHEDHVMNLRYGFIKEVQSKYKDDYTVRGKQHASRIIKTFQDVFAWLPLATVINGKVLVAHGGISDKTDLTFLNSIDRYRYKSVLKPPLKEGAEPITGDDDDLARKVDFVEWRQVLDVLWSDPKLHDGCSPNSFRGGGSYFGPDVTRKILAKHNLDLLIRSHECKPEGYEFIHDGLVLTVFSASNYYEIGSNRGAYVKLGMDLKPQLVQYMVSKSHQKLTTKQRVSRVESSAMRDLKEIITANKSKLKEAYLKFDPQNTGFITVNEWAHAMNETLDIAIQWRTLKERLVRCNDEGLVEYESCLELEVLYSVADGDGPSITEALYRNKSSLETIFRTMDKDQSGTITMDEFEDACELLSSHIGTTLSKESIRDMARCIDINKDGIIDFNEFLEAFRLVDPHGNQFAGEGEHSQSNSVADLKAVTDELQKSTANGNGANML